MDAAWDYADQFWWLSSVARSHNIITRSSENIWEILTYERIRRIQTIK